MEKKNYMINLIGCDDVTSFFMELTSEEFDLMERVCKESKETSTYICMPTMEIKEITN